MNILNLRNDQNIRKYNIFNAINDAVNLDLHMA